MKYYVYIHIRLDKNTPFYVGIGTKRNRVSHVAIYHRAYTKIKKSVLWLNIANKHGYRVEIVFESNDRFEIKKEEIRLISYYGRKDHKKGGLVNNTDGGDGRQFPNKESMLNVGKNLLQYAIERRKKVYQYSLEGEFIKEWNSLTEAYLSLGCSSSSGILQCCQKKCKKYKGFIWSYTFEDNIVLDKSNGNDKKIEMFDLDGNSIKVYPSLRVAAKENKLNFAAISLAALGKTKTSGGFKWKYIN